MVAVLSRGRGAKDSHYTRMYHKLHWSNIRYRDTGFNRFHDFLKLFSDWSMFPLTLLLLFRTEINSDIDARSRTNIHWFGVIILFSLPISFTSSLWITSYEWWLEFLNKIDKYGSKWFHPDANFAVTGGTGGCCHHWRKSWHHDNSRLSVCPLFVSLMAADVLTPTIPVNMPECALIGPEPGRCQ